MNYRPKTGKRKVVCESRSVDLQNLGQEGEVRQVSWKSDSCSSEEVSSWASRTQITFSKCSARAKLMSDCSPLHSSASVHSKCESCEPTLPVVSMALGEKTARNAMSEYVIFFLSERLAMANAVAKTCVLVRSARGWTQVAFKDASGSRSLKVQRRHRRSAHRGQGGPGPPSFFFMKA